MKNIGSHHIARINLSYLPPGTPSLSEQKIYEKYVKKLSGRNGVKALILGSTPELRDLCQKHNVKYICVDYEPKNFQILKNKMKYRGEEKLVTADWRTMNLSEKFDLVLGDIAFAMVPYSDLDKILNRLQKILKASGLIVQRTYQG